MAPWTSCLRQTDRRVTASTPPSDSGLWPDRLRGDHPSRRRRRPDAGASLPQAAVARDRAFRAAGRTRPNQRPSRNGRSTRTGSTGTASGPTGRAWTARALTRGVTTRPTTSRSSATVAGGKPRPAFPAAPAPSSPTRPACASTSRRRSSLTAKVAPSRSAAATSRVEDHIRDAVSARREPGRLLRRGRRRAPRPRPHDRLQLRRHAGAVGRSRMGGSNYGRDSGAREYAVVVRYDATLDPSFGRNGRLVLSPT